MSLQIPSFPEGEIPIRVESEWLYLAKALKERKTTSESRQIKCITFLADNNVYESGFTTENSSYTSSMAILASENDLIRFKNSLVIDIAVNRYFPDLGSVKNYRVANGTKNFFIEEALEPMRLRKAIEAGHTVIDKTPETLIYLNAIGAGTNLAGECLVRSIIGSSSSPLVLENSSSKKALEGINKVAIDNSHPFNHLLRFGGYDTAAVVGSILQSVQNGKYIFIEGWSAIAAYLICQKMYPEIANFVQLVSPEKGDIYSELAGHLNIKTLFSNSPLNQKAFFAQSTQAIVNEILSEIND